MGDVRAAASQPGAVEPNALGSRHQLGALGALFATLANFVTQFAGITKDILKSVSWDYHFCESCKCIIRILINCEKPAYLLYAAAAMYSAHSAL